MDSIYRIGAEAFIKGKKITDNPFQANSDDAVQWAAGWNYMLNFFYQSPVANQLPI